MDGDRLRQAANVVLAITQVTMAALSSTGVFGGASVGAISDRFDSSVVPAGYTFAIWSVIYPLSLAYAVYQARPAVRTDPRLRRTGWWTAAAFAASSVWIVAFQQEVFVLAQAVIAVLLVTLAVAYGRLLGADRSRRPVERVLVDGHAGLYLAWATVATLAGASQTLLSLGGEAPAGSPGWGILVLLVGGGVAAWVTTVAGGEAAYPAAVVWGLAGVAVGQFTSSAPVGVVAVLAALLVVAAFLRARTGRGGRAAGRGRRPAPA